MRHGVPTMKPIIHNLDREEVANKNAINLKNNGLSAMIMGKINLYINVVDSLPLL